MEQITNESLIEYLKERATEEAEEGEFHPEEHTLWITAERMEELISLIAMDNVPERLHLIANMLASMVPGKETKSVMQKWW